MSMRDGRVFGDTSAMFLPEGTWHLIGSPGPWHIGDDMFKTIITLFCLSIPCLANAAGPTPAEIDDAIDNATDDATGLATLRDIVIDLEPDAGGSCKFQYDSKSCGMVCDTIGVTCSIRDDIAYCQICTPAGCSSFKTDGCDPTTWP